MSLFDGEPEGAQPVRHAGLGSAPLAERMRPTSLDEYSGQEHLLGPGKPLRVQIERESVNATATGSMIFWGPPVWARQPWPKSSPRPPRPPSLSFLPS